MLMPPVFRIKFRIRLAYRTFLRDFDARILALSRRSLRLNDARDDAKTNIEDSNV